MSLTDEDAIPRAANTSAAASSTRRRVSERSGRVLVPRVLATALR
jgi:hypothetical protein